MSTRAIAACLALCAACHSPPRPLAPPTTTHVAASVDASDPAAGPADPDDARAASRSSPGAAEPADAAPLSTSLPRFAGGTLPAYPAIARRLGEEGAVVVTLDVRQDGEVQAIAITTTSGHARLDEAVLAAARTWRFLPRTGERGVDRIAHRFVFRLSAE